MEGFLYKILLLYFFLGAFLTHFTNQKKDKASAKKNWIKYLVYLLIVNGLFASILLGDHYFSYLSLIIILMGFMEILSNTRKAGKNRLGFRSLLVFAPLTVLFFLFSLQPGHYLFYTLFIITVFDAFSQLSGQLLGRHRITSISPNKTYEGLLGGSVVAILTAVLIRNLLGISPVLSALIGGSIILVAFGGDLLASLVKRKLGIKDYSHLLPGHGGFLDRFDSLIPANALMYLIIPLL